MKTITSLSSISSFCLILPATTFQTHWSIPLKLNRIDIVWSQSIRATFHSLNFTHQLTKYYLLITIFYSSNAILVYLIWFTYSSSISVFYNSTVSGINPHKQLPHWIILAIAIPKIKSSDSPFLASEVFFMFLRCLELWDQGRGFP